VIEQTLKALTAIGSVLGTVAFVQNLSKEVTANNKAQWEKLAAIVSPVDFDELQYDLSTDRIRQTLRDKMDQLAYGIHKSDYSITGFKSLIGSRIQRKLKIWYGLYTAFQQLAQVPYWNPVGQPPNWQGYKLDKQLFYNEMPDGDSKVTLRVADKKLNEHRDALQSIAEQMETLFVEIQRLANRDSFELVLPWKWR
jgi:hypothetical protein